MQQLQNPLAESEQIKAQATLIKARNDNEVKVLQEQNDMRQFLMEMAQKNEEFQKTMALKLTELELDHNQDLNAQVEDNKV